MALPNIFDKEVSEKLIHRIANLTPDTQRQWGKMEVAQMLAHCSVTYETVYEPEYTGKAMTESHRHLNISEKEWGVMAMEFKKSLDTFKVPVAEQKELFDIVGTTKADIVVRK